MTELDTPSGHDWRHEVVLFRYGMIADVVHLSPLDKGLYRRLDEKAAPDPGTSRIQCPREASRYFFDASAPPHR